MTCKTALSVSLAAAAAAALTLAALPARAQDPAYDGPSYGRYQPAPPPPTYGQPVYDRAAYDQSGDIVVTAPTYRGRDPATGATIREYHAARLVSYRDLDLGSPQGVRALHRRIDRAARSACTELEEHIPNGMPDAHECVDQAVLTALHQVRYDRGDQPYRY